MPLQLFLNELSEPKERLSRAISIGYLKQLVATVRHAQRVDSAFILNSEVPISQFSLGEGTTIASVRNTGECVEESIYLKTINNRAPLNLLESVTCKVDPNDVEYRLPPTAPVRSSEVALGLGYAHFLDGLGVSLASHDYWLERFVELDASTLDSAGEIVIKRVVARNADSPAAFADHEGALRSLIAPTIQHGAELWERRTELLPNLVFIPRTRSQLESIRPGDPILDQAWIKLRGIDQAIAAWRIVGGPYPMFPFNVRPESKGRLALARFRDDDGNIRLFSDHCDLAPTEGRIHFIVESQPRSHALIGHVGRKLGIG